MFCGKTANNRISRLHKRALRVLHNDYTSTFEDLLEKSEEVTVHCSNLQKLIIKIYECTNYIGPAVLTEFFTTKEISYDLRIKNLLQIPKVKTSYGQSSLSFRSSILWNTLSDSKKPAQNIQGFKTMIRNWKGETCSCIVCKCIVYSCIVYFKLCFLPTVNKLVISIIIIISNMLHPYLKVVLQSEV